MTCVRLRQATPTSEQAVRHHGHMTSIHLRPIRECDLPMLDRLAADPHTRGPLSVRDARGQGHECDQFWSRFLAAAGLRGRAARGQGGAPVDERP